MLRGRGTDQPRYVLFDVAAWESQRHPSSDGCDGEAEQVAVRAHRALEDFEAFRERATFEECRSQGNETSTIVGFGFDSLPQERHRVVAVELGRKQTPVRRPPVGSRRGPVATQRGPHPLMLARDL